MNYEEYISSSQWRQLRQQRLEHDGHRCQCCGDTEDLEVHHKYDGPPDYRYPKPLGEESVEDLLTLCHRCHEAITDSVRRRRYIGQAIEVQSVTRISSVSNRGLEYEAIEVSTTVRITPTVPQRTDSRSKESLCC